MGQTAISYRSKLVTGNLGGKISANHCRNRYCLDTIECIDTAIRLISGENSRTVGGAFGQRGYQ